ncbi:MAG: hypothetical protein HC906_05935 [Bacteroidales bacterium]|nr:hypothetical protein [Bacteroidales bacterium]
MVVEGSNPYTSLVDGLLLNIGDADIYSFNPFSLERLAFDSYIIDFDVEGFTPVPQSTYQRRVTTTNGGIGGYSFALGTNFSHKLYLGFDLSILRVRYDEETKYSEFDKGNISNELLNTGKT